MSAFSMLFSAGPARVGGGGSSGNGNEYRVLPSSSSPSTAATSPTSTSTNASPDPGQNVVVASSGRFPSDDTETGAGHDDEEDSSLLEKGWGAVKPDGGRGSADGRGDQSVLRWLMVSWGVAVSSATHSVLDRSDGTDSPTRRRRRRKLAVLVLGLVALVLTAIVYAVLACGVPAREEQELAPPPALEPMMGDAASNVLDGAELLDLDVEDAALLAYLAQSIDSTTHRIFRAAEDDDRKQVRLRPTRSLPDECLDLWFTHGEVCSSAADSLPLGPEEQLDIVYLWVNGSDPIWQQERALKAEQALVHKASNGKVVHDSSSDKHYRDIGGFEYNLRSAVDSFQRNDTSSKIRKIHVLSADFAAADSAHLRIGQVPSWLVDDGGVGDDERPSSPELQWHFHSEVFRSGLDFEVGAAAASAAATELEWATEAEWRATALPTFNSFAIESRLAWLDDLGDASVQSNDDMYFLGSLAASDFHSPLYGSVFRLEPSSGLMVKPILQSNKVWDAGEWGGLQHANWLLSRRFPARTRQYINHVPKTLSKPILDEVSVMFARDISTAAARPFRESHQGDGDIEFAFLITHMRIERWREALLWTWAVAKLGHREDGMWGQEARREIAQVLGLEGVLEDTTVQVKKYKRQTLRDVPKSFDQAGWEGPQATTYSFSSMDGHLPATQSKIIQLPNGKSSKVDVAVETCSLNTRQCFGDFLDGADVIAQDMFKRITFDDWRCGDCLIDALVAASGDKGLSTFLPDAAAIFASASSLGDEPAHLPLTDDWVRTDFSIAAVIQSPGTVHLRTWTEQLLSRYLYISGDSESQFSQIHSPYEAQGAVNTLDSKRTIKLACLNDDFFERYATSVAGVLKNWAANRWSDLKPWWEK